jgi:hypothetical protein
MAGSWDLGFDLAEIPFYELNRQFLPRPNTPPKKSLKGEKPAGDPEQVCRALDVCFAVWFRNRRGTSEVSQVNPVIRYHERRKEQATRSHKKRRHRTIT